MTNLKKIARNGAKTSIHKTLVSAKYVLTKNPRIKNTIKRSIIPHLVQQTFKPDNYTRWVWDNMYDYMKLPLARKQYLELKNKPLISVLIPTYNTDILFLRDCLDSVIGQVYEDWQLCIVDDCSTNEEVRDAIKEYAEKDKRITYKFLSKNQHIADATNGAAELAKGDFLVLFDHDDILWPNALLEVAKTINDQKDIDFMYSDEDKITEDTRQHLGPFFKPDVNQEFLRSVNYVTHMSVVRRSLFNKLGGLRAEYNGAQDWDFFLRVFRSTKNIHHIPKVLYSWRIHDLSTAKNTDAKPYVVEAQKKAITDDLITRGYTDAVVTQDEKYRGYWNVTFPVHGNPLISIVIPSKNQYKVVKRCINSIYKKTTYDNFEIILVDTGSDDKKVLDWYAKLQKTKSNFKLVNWDEKPFSYARSCNEGARHAKGELLVMLNNDTEIITPDWLEKMAGDAQRKEIGIVGSLLFFPDGYHIQHAGVGVGLGGLAANSFSMATLTQPLSQTQHLYLNTRHEMTAVTAACFMMRQELFEEIGGFDEVYRVTYNDVDLCLRVFEKGYKNLYTPYVRLIHHESISVGLPEEISKRDTGEMKIATELFMNQWLKYIQHDPNINPQIDKSNAFYDIPTIRDPSIKTKTKK